jgi:hypothetical protein
LRVNKKALADFFRQVGQDQQQSHQRELAKYRRDVIKEMKKNLKDAEDGSVIKRKIKTPEPINDSGGYTQLANLIENANAVAIVIDGVSQRTLYMY